MTVQERMEQIYEAERGSIYSYLLYFGLTPDRAQEVAQDAFLVMYRKMLKGGQIENPRAWLYKVAHNLALRTHTREPQFDVLPPELESVDTRMNPEQALLDQAEKTALADAIRDLSPQQRNCLHLRVQGLRYREIAETIGISTSAVGEFLRRAAVRLKGAFNA